MAKVVTHPRIDTTPQPEVSFSGHRYDDPTGDGNVHYYTGTYGLTTSLYAKDRSGQWRYVGLYYGNGFYSADNNYEYDPDRDS